jgi:hypothetical protein
MVSANDMQIAGNHYAAEYQHWDWVADVGLGYLEGCATKYVCRAFKKNGLEDLQKATHYLAKMQELQAAGTLRRPFILGDHNKGAELLDKFMYANRLTTVQHGFCYVLQYLHPEDVRYADKLNNARAMLAQLAASAERRAVAQRAATAPPTNAASP